MKSETKKDRSEEIQGAELDALNKEFGQNGTAAIKELENSLKDIKEINVRKASMTLNQRAGFAAEEWHAGTFNASARKSGDFDTTAMTGTKGGFGIDRRADIKIIKAGKVIAEAQAKYAGSAPRSAVSVAKAAYRGTQRLVPADQVSTVKKALEKSAAGKALSANPRMRQVGAVRAEAAGRVTDRLKVGRLQGRPLRHADAVSFAKGETMKLTKIIVTETVTTTTTAGATSGALVGGVMSGFASVYDVSVGNKTAQEAAEAFVIETAKAGVRGGMTSLTAEGVKVAVRQTLPLTVVKRVVGGPGPMAMAGCFVDIAQDVYKGELTVSKTARHVTRAAGGWAGAEGGAALGTLLCPGLGTVAGGVIGGILGSFVGGSW